MRIVCPQSTLDVLGEGHGPMTRTVVGAVALTSLDASSPDISRRIPQPIPHDRQQAQTPRYRPHPYANTRTRGAAVMPTNVNVVVNPKGDVDYTVLVAAVEIEEMRMEAPLPARPLVAAPTPKRIPRITNSTRNALHYNALHRENSTRRLRPRNRDAKLEKVEAARKKESLKKECVVKGKEGRVRERREEVRGGSEEVVRDMVVGEMMRENEGEGSREKVVRRRRRVNKNSALNLKEYKYVYVGNLPTSITEARIQEFFTLNGVRDLDGLPSIRTTGGTVGAVVIPTELRTERDRRYACVRFKSHDSVSRALKLNGTLFEGMQVVVTIDPTNLPECHQILASHMQEIEDARKMQLGMGKQIRGTPSPLQLQDTEKAITSLLQQNANGYGAGRVKIFGYSFAPCIS